MRSFGIFATVLVLLSTKALSAQAQIDSALINDLAFHRGYFMVESAINDVLLKSQKAAASHDLSLMDSAFSQFQALKKQRLRRYVGIGTPLPALTKQAQLGSILKVLDQETAIVDFLEYTLPQKPEQYNFLVCYISQDSVRFYTETMPIGLFLDQVTHLKSTVSYTDYLFWGKNLYMRLYKRIGKALRGMKTFICPDVLMGHCNHHALLHAIPPDSELLKYSALSYTAKIMQMHYALNALEAYQQLLHTKSRHVKLISWNKNLPEHDEALVYSLGQRGLFRDSSFKQENQKPHFQNLVNALIWANRHPKATLLYASGAYSAIFWHILETNFEKQIQKGLPLHLAWHYALKYVLEKSQLPDSLQAPHLWANLRLVGNITPIRLPNSVRQDSYYSLFYTLLFILAVCFLRFFWHKTHKNFF